MIQPSLRKPAIRVSAITILLGATALAGCATAKRPPEIAYDNAPPAVLQPEVPAPVTVVETPTPLPLPGQLKPMERVRSQPEAADPAARVALANAAARMQPVRDGFVNAVQVYPFTAGALYQVYTAPGQITDIALQPGEQLVGAGPVAAGDTVRWIIGDTESGTGATRQVHILVKPTRAGLLTNLVINTDRRTYHVELRALERTYMASVSWQYPQDQLIALRRQNQLAEAARPVATGIDLTSVNFRYAIEGDRAPWRPLRAFDDGRQVFIEFPTGIAQGEMPPLFVVGPEGKTSELVNYRVRGRHMIVDRLFAAAELRLGSGRDQRRVRIVRTDGVRRGVFSEAHGAGAPTRSGGNHYGRAGIVSEQVRDEEDDAQRAQDQPRTEEAAVPDDDALPLTGAAAEPMRLRADPPRVTRLSRKVLTGIGVAAGVGLGGALMYGLQTRDVGRGPEELVAPGNRNPPPGMDALPADYGGVPKLGPPLPGDLGRSIVDAQNRGQPVPVPPAAPGAPVPAQTGPSPEEQRRRQEIEAARTSQLFASTETRNAGSVAPAGIALPVPQPDLASLGLAPPPATPSAEARKQAFLNAETDRRTTAPDRVAAPASPNILQAGAVIPAALITGIRSDLPGQITAQVTENVYDSPTGRILLVPQGTRVVGQYDNDVGFGQQRVLLVWTRLIFPNGRSIVLERQPGADAEGYAGVEDGVDYHWGQLARAAALSTLLSISAQAGSSSQESDLARAIRQGASDSVSQTGRQVVGRQLDIAPTLTVRPGFPVRVLVVRDLVLEPYGETQ